MGKSPNHCQLAFSWIVTCYETHYTYRGSLTLEHLSSCPPPESGERRFARRTSRRMPLNAVVEVLEPAFAEGVTINASAGGLRIAVDQPLEVSLECLVKITYSSGKELIRRAQVVWSRVLPDGCIAGMKFIDVH